MSSSCCVSISANLLSLLFMFKPSWLLLSVFSLLDSGTSDETGGPNANILLKKFGSSSSVPAIFIGQKNLSGSWQFSISLSE